MSVTFITRKHDTNDGRVIETATHETALKAVGHAYEENHACTQVGQSPDTVPLMIETNGDYTLEVNLENGQLF